MSPQPKLSVIVPAFNEERNIPGTLQSIRTYRDHKDFTTEIVVVDDGSTDRTSQHVQNFKDRNDDVSILTFSKNRGKGHAVQQGMLRANGRLRLFMDADSSTSIHEFDKMLPYFQEGRDIVIGTRRSENSRILRQRSGWRRYGSMIFNWFVRLLHDLNIKDTQVGFKAFRGTTAKAIFSRLMTEGWAFDVEVLVIARLLGFKITPVPITWKNHVQSNLHPQDIVPACLDVYKIHRRWTRRTLD